MEAKQDKLTLLPWMDTSSMTVASPSAITTAEASVEHHVIVIGAGVSGLVASLELLKLGGQRVRITIVEACSEVGGRILGVRDLVDGHVIELGAEFVHGKGTVLTDFVKEYTPRWTHHLQHGETQLPLYQDIFVTSYADGGPSIAPTKDGKYGMYYCKGELMNFDDERLHPLERALGTKYELPHNEMSSIQDAVAHLPMHLQHMARSGYGNTAGNTKLQNTSLSMMLAFEKHWEESEFGGDGWLNSRVSMSGVMQEIFNDLQQHSNVEIKTNWCVNKVEERDDGVHVRSSGNLVLVADSVILTMPPKYWSDLLELPHEKEVARNFVGGETAIKIILKFRERLWPSGLQMLICADELPVPELWFREFGESHIVVCFLNSGFAEGMLELCKGHCDERIATPIVLSQLSTVLSISMANLESNHVETRMHVWDVGYMFPKVGLTPKLLADMAKPFGNIYFAGEGTHTRACCTVQAAMETGIRAAQQILEKLQK